MSYFYMSNIDDFSAVTDLDSSYQEVGVYNSENQNNSTTTNGIINFTKNGINYSASFLMIRARYDNDLLVQISPYNYGVYIPANELWSVDSLDKIDKIIVRNIFKHGENDSVTSATTGYIQWMIGYK